MRYLLDTNICIYLLQAHPPQVVQRFKTTLLGDVLMSVVTYAELCHGVERCIGRDRDVAAQALGRLILRIPVLAFENNAAQSYGRLAAALSGGRRDALDRLIAAHAISAGLTVVTNNEADFKDYPGLKLENWVASS